MATYNHKCLIIGAGPAGLQLAYFMEKSAYDYLVLEVDKEVGAFFKTFPRTRTLISFNKIYSIYDDPEIQLRWDWNSLLTDDYGFLFRDYSKELYPDAGDLVRYLQDFTKHYDLKVKNNCKIINIKKDEKGSFVLLDQDDNIYTCKCLVMATGLSKSYIPPIPGIDLVSEAYENLHLDPQDFINQKVLIIGKGNSAYEIADTLLDVTSILHLASPESTRLAWNSRFSGHLRANYTKILDTYQLKLLNGNLDCHIKGIEKTDNNKFKVTIEYIHADGEIEEIIYDRIIRCAGFQFDDTVFDPAYCPHKASDKRFPDMNSNWESTNIPDLYFAGTLMQVRDFQKASTAFIDGFRYNVRTLFNFLASKLYDKPLPSLDVNKYYIDIANTIMDRICRTSALWAQFGYLCDVIVIDKYKDIVKYFPELPVDYVHDYWLSNCEHYYTITFEWGSWDGDVFAIERHPKNDTAYTNAFLHPIIRHYSKKQLIEEHHVLEDLFGMYRNEGETGIVLARGGRDMEQYHMEEHKIPLLNFIEKSLQYKIGDTETINEIYATVS